MRIGRIRLLGAAAVLAGLLLSATSAQAAVTASSVASPDNHSRFLYDTSASSTTVFTVTGTTTGSGNVDVDCYDGNGNRYLLASNVTVSGNSFSAAITTSELVSATLDTTCVLRAVPTGDTNRYPPDNSPPFAGPFVAFTKTNIVASGGQTVDYFYGMNGFAAGMQFGSAGEPSLGAHLFEPTTFTSTINSFNGVGGLLADELKVDGIEAFDANQAESAKSGYQGLTVSQSFDPSTGNLTISEVEPLLFCQPSPSSCSGYTGSGVGLDRTWQETQDGTVADQTDVFRSVDGKQHSLNALEDDEIFSPAGFTGHGDTAAFRFPGSPAWQDYAKNATVPLPGGANSIYFKVDGKTPDAGDGVNPQGAISYAAAPSGPVRFTVSDENSSGSFDEFVMPYSRTIPAGGSTVLRFSYTQAFGLATAQSSAQAALGRFAPQLTITSPANGVDSTSPTATVSGTASDSVGVESLTVNGRSVAVGSGGAWSTPVSLKPGANVLTAVLTGEDGDTTARQLTVNLVPHFKLKRSLKATTKAVTFKVSCLGQKGQVCHGLGQVITVEKLKRRKVVGLTTVQGKHHRRVVVLGAKRFSLKVGKTMKITLKLKGATAKLLAQFGHIPAVLKLSLLNARPPIATRHRLKIK